MMESKNPSVLSPSGNNRDKIGTVLPTDQSENVRMDTEVYELTPYRWILLTSFSCAVTASSFVMMTFVPGAGITAVVYDVPPIYVNSCVVLFLVSFIVFNFASISALENLGLAKTVSTSYPLIFDNSFHLVPNMCNRSNSWSMASMGDTSFLR